MQVTLRTLLRPLSDALRGRDPFLLAGCVGAAGGVLATVVLFADILHLWVDPRLRRSS